MYLLLLLRVQFQCNVDELGRISIEAIAELDLSSLRVNIPKFAIETFQPHLFLTLTNRITLNTLTNQIHHIYQDDNCRILNVYIY